MFRKPSVLRCVSVCGRSVEQTGSVIPEPSVATLVLLVGPQASGKSTLATALSEELRRRGELVALVELDQIAAMALPTLPNWDIATHILGSSPISGPEAN